MDRLGCFDEDILRDVGGICGVVDDIVNGRKYALFVGIDEFPESSL